MRWTLVAVLSLLIVGNTWADSTYWYYQGKIPFYIERPTIKAVFSLEREQEVRTGPFINIKKDLTRATQKFEIQTRGFVYHPSLVVYEAVLRPEFRQYSQDADNGFEEKIDSTFMGYLLDTTWLRNKPYSFNLFASRDRNDVSNSLSTNTVTNSSIYRGRVVLDYPVFPTKVTLQRSDVISRGFYSSADKEDSLRIQSKKDTDKTRTILDIDMRTTDRVIQGSASTVDRASAFIDNYFDIDQKKRLTSSLQYTNSTSTGRDSQTAQVQSELRINHRENFNTSYSLQIRRQDELDWSSNTYGVSAGLSHQLYENLTTGFNINSTREDSSNGNQNTNTAALDFRYRRAIPWGQLLVNLGVRERIRDNQRDGSVIQIREEPHAFAGATTQVFLDNLNIDEGTIVVTDASGTIIYVKGVDYIVDRVGASTRITRDPFGGIGDNQSILVDYKYRPDPPAKTGLTSTNFGVNLLLWKNLTLYYQSNRSRERQISGDFPIPLQNDKRQKTGGELKWGWTRTLVEYEDNDTRISPYKRFLVSETLSLNLHRSISLGLGAAYTETELRDTGEITKGVRADANLTWHVGATGQLRARAYFLNARSSVQDTQSKGAIATYEWLFGAWQPRLRYEFLDDINSISGDNRTRHSIYFEIARVFF